MLKHNNRVGYSSGVANLTTEMLGNDKAVAQTVGEGFVMQYCCNKAPGATCFFTIVTIRRRKILCETLFDALSLDGPCQTGAGGRFRYTGLPHPDIGVTGNNSMST